LPYRNRQSKSGGNVSYLQRAKALKIAHEQGCQIIYQ
jgi:hypothetical protein